MSENGPERLYVIIGRRIDEALIGRKPLNDWATYVEPPYPTDPAHYGLTVVDPQDEVVRKYQFEVRAFINREDAIHFGCRLNLAGFECPVVDRAGGEWVYNSDETSLMADEFG